jgi:hypothetical protein
MNDRLSAFCAGVGAAGLLVLAGDAVPTVGAIVHVIFMVLSVGLIIVGVMDYICDHALKGG